MSDSKQFSIMTMGRDSLVVGMSIEGLEEVQAKLDSLAEDLREKAAVEMVQDVGEAVKAWMKENIYKNFWRHPTGALAGSIFATVLTNDEGAVCFVGPNVSEIPYVLIHEYGGDIYPKNKKFLSWIGDDGKRVFSKHVHIPARPYMAPAYDDHMEEIIDMMKEDLDNAIAEGCTNL